MSAGQYIPVIARKHQLPEQLVAAIVQVESGGDRFAMRHEPAYPWLWDVARRAPRATTSLTASRRLPPDDFTAPPGVSKLTEWMGQQTSWGYMQVMGAVARELGFAGRFFTELCDPMEGLNYGCLHLTRLRRAHFDRHGWPGVAAAYNAGAPRFDERGAFRNQSYVDKVARAGGFEVL
jgi:soluble lytic murein transglycosylase-like protein